MNPWIPHDGGGMPVGGGDVRVQYKLQDGHIDLGVIGQNLGYPAADLDWETQNPYLKIIAYRIVKDGE